MISKSKRTTYFFLVGCLGATVPIPALAQPWRVWNLQISEHHCFTTTKGSMWVHNASIPHLGGLRSNASSDPQTDIYGLQEIISKATSMSVSEEHLPPILSKLAQAKLLARALIQRMTGLERTLLAIQTGELAWEDVPPVVSTVTEGIIGAVGKQLSGEEFTKAGLVFKPEKGPDGVYRLAVESLPKGPLQYLFASAGDSHPNLRSGPPKLVLDIMLEAAGATDKTYTGAAYGEVPNELRLTSTALSNALRGDLTEALHEWRHFLGHQARVRDPLLSLVLSFKPGVRPDLPAQYQRMGADEAFT